jgi:SHS2 domain-containing protein
MFETFEHTADLGLRVRAGSVNQLFEEAARALFSAIVDNLDSVQPRECFDTDLENDEIELLLFDWLRELLYRFDVEHIVFAMFQVEVQNQRLHGKAWGEPLDRARHHLLNEVKAITYHGLRLEQAKDGWLAEVIVDI